MTREQLMLQSNLEACRQRIEKLRYSIAKNSYLFPIPLEIIEVQSGSYLGEDDIVRFEDTYGRTKAS